jgi:hypothetical protein
MAETGYDVAVCGSSPFAMLLAGQLATLHGKRVCLVGDPWSPYRLARRVDLSVMPATRPETWSLLKAGGAETLKLLGGIGRGLFERVDPLFVAETPAEVNYLGHMRWMAAGFGFAAERAVDRAITATGAICRIRDAAMLVGGKAEPALEAWLGKSGIRRAALQHATLTARRDGTASLTLDGQAVEAATVVLADDAAILAHLPPAERHRLLGVLPATSLLTDPAKPLGAALIHYLDRGVTLHQRGTKGSIAAIAGGEPETATARIAAGFAGQGTLRRSGQTQFRTIETTDGAPFIGRTGKSRWLLVAGLGMSAAFLAPAVARLLAGTPGDDEARWFAARDPGKAAQRPAIAESIGAAATEPQP